MSRRYLPLIVSRGTVNDMKITRRVRSALISLVWKLERPWVTTFKEGNFIDMYRLRILRVVGGKMTNSHF